MGIQFANVSEAWSMNTNPEPTVPSPLLLRRQLAAVYELHGMAGLQHLLPPGVRLCDTSSNTDTFLTCIGIAFILFALFDGLKPPR